MIFLTPTLLLLLLPCAVWLVVWPLPGRYLRALRSVCTLLLVAALVTLWYAYTLTSSWQGFSEGRLSLVNLKSNAIQGSIVVMLMMYIIW